MTFEFRCDCGAVLLLVVKRPEEVKPMLDAHKWKHKRTFRTYYAWTDTIPAKCISCLKDK